MFDEASLRSRPAAEGARVLALRYLDEATQAAPRLTDDGDLEALHDFRVGLRRLRSVLRAYKAELSDTIRRKDRERIAVIARSTTDGRDAEVQLAWLTKRAASAPAKMKPGVTWVSDRVRERMQQGYHQARSESILHFAKADKALRERLSYYDMRVRLGVQAKPPTFGEVTGQLLRQHVGELVAQQLRIGSAADQENIHETRIAAKRLRYLLEPLREEAPRSAPLVKRLKELQDVLGDLHDMHVMAHTLGSAVEIAATERARRMHTIAAEGEPTSAAAKADMRRDERDGLLWLTTEARNDRDRLFAQFNKTFSPSALDALVADVNALADEIGKRDDIEIERKYLLSRVPREALKAPYDDIDQGYIPGNRLFERIRKIKGVSGERYFRTIKLGSGVTRTEIEEECSAEIYRKLWPLTRGQRIFKRRYRIDSPAGVWELDVFKKRKLALVEIELDSEDADATPPEWLAPCIVREVTEEAAYTNASLAS